MRQGKYSNADHKFKWGVDVFEGKLATDEEVVEEAPREETLDREVEYPEETS